MVCDIVIMCVQQERAATFLSQYAAWHHSVNIRTCVTCIFVTTYVRTFVFYAASKHQVLCQTQEFRKETLEILSGWSNNPHKQYTQFLGRFRELCLGSISRVFIANFLNLTQNLIFDLCSSLKSIVKTQMRSCMLSQKHVQALLSQNILTAPCIKMSGLKNDKTDMTSKCGGMKLVWHSEPHWLICQTCSLVLCPVNKCLLSFRFRLLNPNLRNLSFSFSDMLDKGEGLGELNKTASGAVTPHKPHWK